MTEEVPSTVIQNLPAAIADAKDGLFPADIKSVTSLLDRLFATLPMPDKAGLKVWAREMSRYPADLLDDAVDEVIRTHKWETVPKLAQLVEHVRPEIIKRQAWLNKLETAELKARLTIRRRKPSNAPTGTAKGPMPSRITDLLAETMAKLAASGDDMVAPHDRMGQARKEEVRERTAEDREDAA